MPIRLVLLVIVGLAFASGLASASSRPIYSGGSPKATHQMQIYLYLQPNHRAKWDVYMETPCMGRSIGYGSQPNEPLLRLRHGRFELHKTRTVQTTDIHYTYTLKGHRTPDGFTGTLNYVEIDSYNLPPPQPTTCASTLLHWTAHPSTIFR